MSRNRKGGYILITMAIAMVVLFGALGLAFDLGRAFIAKNELQAYADAAAISAALQLNGRTVGFTNAAAQVLPTSTAPMSVNRWNFSTQVAPNANTTIAYATSAAGPFAAAGTAPLNSGYAEITTAISVPMYILPLVVNSSAMTVTARAVAGQIPTDCLTQGCFPFSPMAHSNVGPNWGLDIGQSYTLRWGSGFGISTCAGDVGTDTRSGLAYNDLARQRSGGNASNRGFVGETANASTYRAEIIQQLQFGLSYQVGYPVSLNSGDNNTIRDALQDLVNQDTDTTSIPAPPSTQPPPDSYDPLNTYTGNFRRLVNVPISDPNNNNIVLGFGAFLLLPTSYYNGGGGTEWCGIYIGGYNQGSHTTAANSGMYKTRLVQ